MIVPAGMTYFWGVKNASVRNQPLISAGLAVVLYNSMASTAGRSSCVKTSLTTTAGRAGGGGSLTAGEPLMALLARQLVAEPQAVVAAFSFTATSENPSPSVAGYQLSLYEKSRIG